MASTRKSEVTKLLTVTLDKIHESKRAKCGPNLRRSLLVASVLHKARDVYVTEIKNIRADQSAAPIKAIESESDSPTRNPTTSTTRNGQQSTISSSPSPSTPTKRKFGTQQSIVEDDVEFQAGCDIDSDSDTYSNDDCQYDEPTQIKRRHFDLTEGAGRLDSTIANDFLDELAAESESERLHPQTDKENNPPSTQAQSSPLEASTTFVKTENELSSSCGRCLKRRSSTTQYEYDSETDLNTGIDSFNNHITLYIPKKRSRITSFDSTESETASPPSLTFKAAVMDTTQINSLVRIFSQSFDVSEDTSPTPPPYTYKNSTEFNTFALCRDSITLTA